MILNIKDDRQMRALTGLPKDKLLELLRIFTQIYEEEANAQYKKKLSRGERKRKRGGGRKGKLPNMLDKLIFVLYYLKVYPTYDVLGTQFDMARSKACENVHKLTPILYKTLVRLKMLPHRKFSSPQEFMQACKDKTTIIIDVTERNYRREQDYEKQREKYSGKKKDTQSKIQSYQQWIRK